MVSYVLDRDTQSTISLSSRVNSRPKRFLLEVIHDQLPLAVPCYDLLPVTELTVGRDEHGRRVFPAPLS